MYSVRHVGITVTDMEKSLELYRNYLGLEVVWDEIEQGDFIDGLSGIKDIKVRTVKMKDSKGGMIELLEYKSHPEKNHQNFEEKITKIGVSHFAVTVKDLDKTYDELIDLGLKFNEKPQVSPDGGAKVCFCRDFDGTLIELVEPLFVGIRGNPENDWLFNLKAHSDLKIQSRELRDKTEFDEPSIFEYLYTFIHHNYKYALDLGACGGSNINYISDKLNWNRLMIDGSKASHDKRTKIEWMTKANIISLLNKYKCPKSLEVISIDLDNMDYWILERILQGGFKSKIIIFEFNPIYKYNECYTKVYFSTAKKNGHPYKMDYSFPINRKSGLNRNFDTSRKNGCFKESPTFTGNAGSSSWYGASLGAFIKLGKRFGYELVYISPAKIDKHGNIDPRYRGLNSNNGWLLNKEYIREDDLISTPDLLHTPYIETFKEKGNKEWFGSNNIEHLKKYFWTNGMIKKV